MSQHEVITILVVLALAPAGAFYLWARSYYQARNIPISREERFMTQVAVNYKNSGRAIEREALALKLSMAFDELDAQYEVKTTEDEKGWHFDIVLYDFGEVKGQP